jgi:hypothetical protein
VLLDEALKMMKTSEKMSVASWIDLMSGMPPSTTSTNTSDQELGGMLTDNR